MTLADSILDWLFDKIGPWLVILAFGAVILFLIALPFMIWADAKAERFSLRKDSWECSRAIDVPTTTYIQSGNVLVPITTYSKECVQWTRKG